MEGNVGGSLLFEAGRGTDPMENQSIDRRGRGNEADSSGTLQYGFIGIDTGGYRTAPSGISGDAGVSTHRSGDWIL